VKAYLNINKNNRQQNSARTVDTNAFILPKNLSNLCNYAKLASLSWFIFYP
jgi:hypothetical protein